MMQPDRADRVQRMAGRSGTPIVTRAEAALTEDFIMANSAMVVNLSHHAIFGEPAEG
jgi:hypothetical protein